MPLDGLKLLVKDPLILMEKTEVTHLMVSGAQNHYDSMLSDPLQQY